jgi:hypothetical protein
MVCSPCERRMRISYDDGRTWTNPVEPFHPSRGEYGAAEFAIDSEDILHVIFGDRARGRTLWHGVWQNGLWAEPEPIVPPIESQIYQEGPENFFPQRPHAALVNGNVLLVTWQTDRGHVHNGTWYSSTTLSAPELPVIPLPSIQETSIPLARTISAAPDPTTTPESIPAIQDDLPRYSIDNPGSSLVLAVFPVVAVIAAVLIFQELLRFRK